MLEGGTSQTNNQNRISYVIVYRDSLNYVPATLDGFAKAFNVKLGKTKFPFNTNTEVFWNKISPWPSKNHYGFEDIPNAKRKAFNKWFRTEHREKKKLVSFQGRSQ